MICYRCLTPQTKGQMKEVKVKGACFLGCYKCDKRMFFDGIYLASYPVKK